MTKHEMAYRALCDAILERLLPEDARLPSSRMLAERWKLSRGTVESVFDACGRLRHAARRFRHARVRSDSR